MDWGTGWSLGIAILSALYFAFGSVVAILGTGPEETREQRIGNLYLGSIALALMAILVLLSEQLV